MGKEQNFVHMARASLNVQFRPVVYRKKEAAFLPESGAGALAERR